MERESKTPNDIYMEMYDKNKIAKNPLFAIEAIGYLKCLSQFFPAQKWIEKEMEFLNLLLLTFTL